MQCSYSNSAEGLVGLLLESLEMLPEVASHTHVAHLL